MDRLTQIRIALATFFRRRWPILAGVLALLLLVIAIPFLFGWGMLRAPAEKALAAKLGRPVAIGSLARVDGVLNPLLELGNVRIGQPAGIPGDMLQARAIRVRLGLVGLLAGRPRPQELEVDGVTVRLVRLDSARASWKGLPGGGRGGGDAGPLRRIAVRDGHFILDDRKRDHQLRTAFTVDDAGLHLAGTGTLIGRPARIRLQGAPLTRPGTWRFRLDYRSPIANLALDGLADKPLDIGHFSADAVATTDSLAHLDLLVEAGLPATQPTQLTTRVRHDRPDWRIERLVARMGGTDYVTALDIRKRDNGRTRLDGWVRFGRFRGEDFADAHGLALAAAKRRAAGPRVIPDTAIALISLARLDGRLDFRVAQLGPPGGIVSSVAGTMTLEQGVLTAKPFVMRVGPGRLAGTIRVTQREMSTRLSADLRLTGTQVGGVLASPDLLSGALAGRFVLDGTGSTVRAALAHADGRLALVARDGAVGRRIALLLGQDAGRAIFSDSADKATLRCAIASFRVADGVARPAPLLIDTSVSQTNGAGTIDLRTERVDLTLTGAPKQDSAIRLAAPIRIFGPLASPRADAPEAKSVGSILKSIGRAIRGDNTPLAGNADCAGLSAAALR